MKKLFTSESVSEGHPDKVADQISDNILDAFLKEDKNSRVACEVFLAKGLVVISGEVTSRASVDITQVARETIEKVGYDSVKKGFDFNSCVVLPLLNNQSANIKKAVGQGKEQGAGDQGIMFGYAVDETEEQMPLSISLAHKLMENLANLRKQGHSFLWPDSKSQVTVAYEGDQVKGVDTVVVSSQHDPDYSLEELREFIKEELIKNTIPSKYLNEKTKILINPAGTFVIGGPLADCGLTGRKIVVDTYGGHGSHGGGAFSGKDPSKVDRSANYVARHIAKNLVAAGLARKCSVQLSYAIGVADPVSVSVDSFNTSSVSDEALQEIVLKNWNLKPNGIIQDLDLLNISYAPTSVYGHFGRKGASFTWEKCDRVDKLKKTLKVG